MRKYIIYTVFFFLLTSCFWSKDEVDEDTNVVNTEIISNSGSNLEEIEDYEIPVFDKDLKEISFSELLNSLYQKWWDDLYDKIEFLSWTWETLETRQKASFLESFVWDYKNALKNREKLCLEEPESSYCDKINLTLTSFLPEDSNWAILDSVNIHVDWRDFWELSWINKLNLENKFVHRVKVSKEWYLDFFKKISIDSNGGIKESLSPILIPADEEELINSSSTSEVSSENFEYKITEDSFVDKNWEDYNWEVKLYMFDLWSDDKDSNVFNLDAFWETWTYAWYSMITYWMPLIIAYDTEWNRLAFNKEMTWKWQIQWISDIPWIDLVNVPKNVYLWRDELNKYWIPPWWNIDLENGVWHEAEMKILDEEWNYEFKYY